MDFKLYWSIYVRYNKFSTTILQVYTNILVDETLTLRCLLIDVIFVKNTMRQKVI